MSEIDRAPSLCTQLRTKALSLHWATVEGATVRAEMVDAIYAAVPPKGSRNAARLRHLRLHLVSEVRAHLRSAANGRLPVGEPEQFEPVRRDPELWEHKWKRTKLGEFRLYHAEPDAGPDVVLLRFHRKEIEERDGFTVEDLQDAQMDIATARYAADAERAWGHSRRRCTSCEDT